MWTHFWDMHSGGSAKEKWAHIYIEAPEAEARVIFYNRFGHSADRVTCTCCGEDYSVSESETLEDATGYQRHCRSAYFDSQANEHEKFKKGYTHRYVEEPETGPFIRPYIPLGEYMQQPDVKIIIARQIKPQEREGVVPEQGYVWVG